MQQILLAYFNIATKIWYIFTTTPKSMETFKFMHPARILLPFLFTSLLYRLQAIGHSFHLALIVLFS